MYITQYLYLCNKKDNNIWRDTVSTAKLTFRKGQNQL